MSKGVAETEHKQDARSGLDKQTERELKRIREKEKELKRKREREHETIGPYLQCSSFSFNLGSERHFGCHMPIRCQTGGTPVNGSLMPLYA